MGLLAERVLCRLFLPAHRAETHEAKAEHCEGGWFGYLLKETADFPAGERRRVNVEVRSASIYPRNQDLFGVR